MKKNKKEKQCEHKNIAIIRYKNHEDMTNVVQKKCQDCGKILQIKKIKILGE